ncbi:uncharacterized protein EV154DRAFT_480317 [Mucor mucedo]|uniref:uncharacterized protein n=1 Tax=Mucor mucedo TaxID=29922 RepID=UPI002220728B|nr:uncharacterized protein EV154DRAFT_480317 [Mucor mucedo]KAI7892371.1 hypothetical protein EV154DRAFT_480317 [Mucor mucedo]
MNLATLEQISKGYSLSVPNLRVLLPRNHAGAIIGPKGQSVRQIQDSHNVFIQLCQVEGSSWGRIINIKGSPTQLSQAWYDCVQLLVAGYQQYYEANGMYANFLFPTELVELLLLEGHLEDMAMSSKTRIYVKYNQLMRSTERIVQIQTAGTDTSSLKCFERAVYRLAELVEQNITISLSMPGTVFYTANLTDDITKYLQRDERDILFDYTEKVESAIKDNNTNDIDQA